MDKTEWFVENEGVSLRRNVDTHVQGFVCGHCGDRATGEIVALHNRAHASYPSLDPPLTVWVLCPGCQSGSVIVRRVQYPAAAVGGRVPNLPEDVGKGYDEARSALGAGCFTATELVCRKLLVYLAVATESSTWTKGKPFAAYIDDLQAAGYLTVTLKRWADVVRSNANAATHELEHVDEERATETLRFTELLLRNLFEMGDFTLPTADDGD